MFPIAQYETHENTIIYLSAVGEFMRSGHCFAFATSFKRICIFDSTQPPDKAKAYFKVDHKITCMIPVQYNGNDVLVIGTDNSLQLYDIYQNTSIFTVIIPDGASSLTIFNNKYIYVGSNCSIYGYTFSGEEIFWTVSGDVVTSMCEIEWHGKPCLLSSSNDLCIRIFDGEESIHERKVHFPVSILKSYQPDTYLICHTNGTILFINGTEKVWSITSNTEIVGVHFLLSTNEISYASTDGTITLINSTTGTIRKTYNSGIKNSGFHLIDFLKDGHQCLLVIGFSGSIRVFMPDRTEGLGREAKQQFDLAKAQPALIKEKSDLLMREFELTNSLHSKEITNNNTNSVLPVIEYRLGQRLDLGCIELRLNTKPEFVILGTNIECPTKNGNSFVVFEMNIPVSSTQNILLNFPDDTLGKMIIDVFVPGNYITFQIEHKIFFGFKVIKSAKPNFFVEFTTENDTFLEFVSSNFVIPTPVNPSFHYCFQLLGTSEKVVISSDGKKCKIECDKVETAGKIVNEYCQQYSIQEFECRSYFPNEIQNVIDVIKKEIEIDDTQSLQKVEIAGLIESLKDTIVRIENADSIGLYQTLFDSVVDCEKLNAEIYREHLKRITNRENFGVGNQKINNLIKKFVELRKGNARNSLIKNFHKEFQTRNYEKIAHLLEYGHEITYQQN